MQTNEINDNFIWVNGQALVQNDATVNKVSWKTVAEMVAGRGCYHYGNATTKKKYVEVRDAMLAGSGSVK